MNAGDGEGLSEGGGAGGEGGMQGRLGVVGGG